jgi:hypothetical protein
MSGFITKKGGGRPLLINGQEVVSGIYQEAISQFDTVYGNIVGEDIQLFKANNQIIDTDY